jgi:hypothetical protein
MDWIAASTASPGACKSPYTNDMMGTNLLEAVQVRNLIEHMIRSDGVPEARARDWRGQFAEREAIDQWRREAVSSHGI